MSSHHSKTLGTELLNAAAEAPECSHVYVLTSRVCDLVKIGKANSVLDRARAFGIEGIDIDRSYALSLNSSRDAVHGTYSAPPRPDVTIGRVPYQGWPEDSLVSP